MARKTPGRGYQSEIAGAVHEMVDGFRKVGLIDKQTMRRFDALCLTPVEPLTPTQIKALREREQVSQPVFARHLNVSKNLVSDWERGVKQPGGPALRLLTIVEKKGLAAIA
jgi:putative transcriptional regulator